MKKLISALLVFVLALGLAVPALADKAKANRSFEGNLVKLTTVEDFSLGELSGLVIDETVGNGALRLEEGAASGTYTSDVIGVEPFEYLVASWNADVPKGAKLEVFVRAYVDMHADWTSWMSWGTWSASITRGSKDSEDALAFMDVDTLTISGSEGESASLVQMKAVLTAAEDGESPVLRQLACTYKNTLEGQAITPAYYGEEIELPASVRLDTPAYSQMIREASIASLMCSATTISVLLNDRGEDVMPEEIALINYDKTYDGFGNWSYSVAAAGSFGYDAYCQYGDFDLLRQELAHGYSVGISVKYSDTQNGSYPYLENAPLSTAGHLITITGYETIDGVDYFYSSDSAAGADMECVRRYRADQLDACWSGRLMYVVHEKEDAAALRPARVAAQLEAVTAEGVENAYALVVDGEKVLLDNSFKGKTLRSDGGGMVLCYVEEAKAPMTAEGAKVTTANKRILYTVSAKNGFIVINPSSVLRDIEGSATVHVLVLMNDGVTYEAVLAMEGAVSTPAPTPTPEATAPATTTEPTPDEETDAPFISEDNGRRLIIIAVAAIGIALIVHFIMVRRDKARKNRHQSTK